MRIRGKCQANVVFTKAWETSDKKS
jgi:hypothetical protein